MNAYALTNRLNDFVDLIVGKIFVDSLKLTINLRLADTLTRAEAAALIVRSRKVNASTAKTNFYDAVSPEVLKIAYEEFEVIISIISPLPGILSIGTITPLIFAPVILLPTAEWIA